MPTKNINTNTNINKININIPKPTRPRQPTQKKQSQSQVDHAEENLSNLENMDTRFVNPSVYGFNRTPLYIPEPLQNTIQQPRKTSKGTSPMTLEEEEEELREPESMATSPISFSSASPVQAQVFSPRAVLAPVDKSGFESMGKGLQLPSDFQARLSRQEGFQPIEPSNSPFRMYQNPNLANAILRRTSMTSGPDINELRNRMFAVKPTGVSNTTPIQSAPPTEIVEKKKGGRPKGTKNKPKPITTETQTGASLNPEQKAKPKKIKRTIDMAQTTLRGQSNNPTIEEID